ncbi:MAG TPA: pilus assembly protein PilE [Gammaproteobacteria bacterium]|jgi:type IV pilus assembly protein PilE|nr:pilus assembly protein PilE [Gammaproteobacteria bacterium]
MNNRGFTLLELMVVVGIIAIIASLAYPSYQDYIGTTYQTQAVSDMKRCALELERQYSNNFTYSGGQCTPLWSPSDGLQSNAQFNLTITATPDSYVITATPSSGNCPIFSLQADGSESTTKCP